MKRIGLNIALGLTFLLAGCASEADQPVSVSLKITGPASAGEGPDACGIAVERARLVIEKLDIENSDDLDEDDDEETDGEETDGEETDGEETDGEETDGEETDGEDSESDDDDDEFEGGPYLVDFTGADINGMYVADFAYLTLPAGSYDELEFEVGPIDPSHSNDVAAAAADPALQEMLDLGASVRITGTVNGVPFDFVSALEETQEREALVEIGDGGEVDGVNLVIDPTGWFVSPAGACLNPNEDEARSPIEENIADSIGLEEDDDRDGDEDDDESEEDESDEPDESDDTPDSEDNGL